VDANDNACLNLEDGDLKNLRQRRHEMA